MPPLDLTDPRNPAPAPRQPRPPQLPALTSVRFFAALYVALYHLVRPFERWGPFTGFAETGYVGVPFFFLLSGFILTYTHASDPGHGRPFLKRFYFARFARIYPVYFVATLASMWVARAQLHNPIHILALLADFFMAQTWSVRMAPFFNVPAWSVSMEVFFYLCFPLVFRRLRTASRCRALVLFAAFWLLALVPPLISLHLAPSPSWHEGGLPASIVPYFVRRFPPFSLPEFLCGVMLGWLFLHHPPSRRTALSCTIFGSIALLVVLFFSAHLPLILLHNGLLIPLFAFLIVGLTQPHVLTRLLSTRPLVLLGEASYALYLTHFMLGDWINATFHTPADFLTLTWKLPIAIGLAIALCIFVERPSRRYLLQWWNRNHPAKTT